MEDHKELFYMKLLEYEENLPKHYDKEKFVLSGLRYEAILNCLDKEKGHIVSCTFTPYPFILFLQK
jgi:hypothetical protein